MDVQNRLIELGLLYPEGHFKRTGDPYHYSTWVDRVRLKAHVQALKECVEHLAKKLEHLGATVVVGTPDGASHKLGVLTAARLQGGDTNTSTTVFSIDALHGPAHSVTVDSHATSIIKGARVVVVADVLERNTSVQKTVRIVQSGGGVVVGVGAICDQRETTEPLFIHDTPPCIVLMKLPQRMTPVQVCKNNGNCSRGSSPILIGE